MITSPCTGLCKLDDTTGWCLGCGRSGNEIAEWSDYEKQNRDEIWDEIPSRLSQLGVNCRRLPWTTDEIATFVADTLKHKSGTWAMGVVGAVAEFIAKPGKSIDINMRDGTIIGRTDAGAISMIIDDDVRALTFDPSGSLKPPRVVLAVKRKRSRPPVAERVTYLGEDKAALLKERAIHLFDLSLGRKEARFCVRVDDGKVKEELCAANGNSFTDNLPKIGPSLISTSPTRVVETALGRIEVQGQIPLPDAKSPLGPHTHLLPQQLTLNRAMPVGMDLPCAYLPGAIFYPSS